MRAHAWKEEMQEVAACTFPPPPLHARIRNPGKNGLVHATSGRPCETKTSPCGRKIRLQTVCHTAIQCELRGCFMEDSSLEAVELHYLNILHVPLTASNIAVRGELGQLPIHLIWILRYWDRLCANDIPMLLKEAVALAHQLGQSGKKCWLRKLQELFNATGLPSAFSYTGCENSLHNLLMTRFRDQYIQNWNSQLSRTSSRKGSAGNKLRPYRLFKTTFELEPYLYLTKIIKHRVALTRLILRSHWQFLPCQHGTARHGAKILPI